VFSPLTLHWISTLRVLIAIASFLGGGIAAAEEPCADAFRPSVKRIRIEARHQRNGQEVFLLSNGIGIGGMTSTYFTRPKRFENEDPGVVRLGMDGRLETDLRITLDNGDEISVPILLAIGRVGAYFEFLRFQSSIEMEFYRFQGRQIRDLLGTYIGIDGQAMCGFGIYAGIAINLKGVCLTQAELKAVWNDPQGLIGGGIAIPILNIRPDYSVIPKGDPFWKIVLSP
jgi:hypothetical protein